MIVEAAEPERPDEWGGDAARDCPDRRGHACADTDQEPEQEASTRLRHDGLFGGEIVIKDTVQTLAQNVIGASSASKN